MRQFEAAVLFFIGSSLIGTAEAAPPAERAFLRKDAAKITDQSRSEHYDDFMRVLWVRPNSRVTDITLGKRAFFTASSFFKPPVSTVDDVLRYVGNRYREGMEFVIMRCKPTPEERPNVEPILATWPNVFAAIASDLAGPGGSCDSPPLTPGESQICSVAVNYRDFSTTIYDDTLAYTLKQGKRMFQSPESQMTLSDEYGIATAFTGLGFAVAGSSTPAGQTVSMSSAEILRNSVVPEYLLKNAPLAAANCRCLQIPEGAWLHQAHVDPDLVWLFGTLEEGACRRLTPQDEEKIRP